MLTMWFSQQIWPPRRPISVSKTFRSRPVSPSPPDSLDVGGDQFTVAAHDPAALVDVHQRVEEGAAADAVVELIATHDDIGAGVPRGLPEDIGVFTADHEGIVLEIRLDVMETHRA